MTCCPSRPASFPSHTESGSASSKTCRSITEILHLKAHRSPQGHTDVARQCESALALSRPADLAVLCFGSSIGSTGASPLLTVTHPMPRATREDEPARCTLVLFRGASRRRTTARSRSTAHSPRTKAYARRPASGNPCALARARGDSASEPLRTLHRGPASVRTMVERTNPDQLATSLRTVVCASSLLHALGSRFQACSAAGSSASQVDMRRSSATELAGQDHSRQLRQTSFHDRVDVIRTDITARPAQAG